VAAGRPAVLINLPFTFVRSVIAVALTGGGGRWLVLFLD
jgi:hypothetical protein